MRSLTPCWSPNTKWFLNSWPHVSPRICTLLTAAEVPRRGGFVLFLCEMVALSHGQSSLTYLEHAPCPWPFLVPRWLANDHSRWMPGTFHCNLCGAGGEKSQLFFFHVYILKEEMTKKIRKEMDEFLSFPPFPEVSSPWSLPYLLHGPQREDIMSWRNSIVYKRNN